MNPKDALREEHGVTMKMLAILHRSFAHLDSLTAEEVADLGTLLDLFDLYVDRCHHGKEEQHLFPALLLLRDAQTDALVGSLVEEHRQARAALKQMTLGRETVSERAEADRNQFEDAAGRFVELVRAHIRKENSALLPLIEDRLSETDREKLERLFRELDETALGSNRLETILSNIEALLHKYGTR